MVDDLDEWVMKLAGYATLLDILPHRHYEDKHILPSGIRSRIIIRQFASRLAVVVFGACYRR